MPAARAIASVPDARALLAEAGALTLVPASPAVPSLIAAIAGGPIRGSWWSHPEGKRIYAVASGLEDAPDVLVAKLVDGKVTYLHRRLWPALLRVVTDPAWRAARSRGLSPAALDLLAAVEAAGELRAADAGEVVGRAALAKARAALEQRALIRSTSEHTKRGHHAAVLQSWRAWAGPKAASAAESLDEALAALRAVGIELATAAASSAPRTRRGPGSGSRGGSPPSS